MLILAKGERIIEQLASFCQKEQILSGCFNAIGAINSVEMAHFDPIKKHYSYKQMSGALEIVSLMGNISRKDKEVVIHSHISVSAEDMLCYGGHLKEAVVAVTCEITLTDFKTPINRAFDTNIGLNLIK